MGRKKAYKLFVIAWDRNDVARNAVAACTRAEKGGNLFQTPLAKEQIAMRTLVKSDKTQERRGRFRAKEAFKPMASTGLWVIANKPRLISFRQPPPCEVLIAGPMGLAMMS